MIIGVGAITPLVNDIIMPPIGLILGHVKDLFISLNRKCPPRRRRHGRRSTRTYGQFLNTVINFIIVAFTIFLVVRTARVPRAGRGYDEGLRILRHGDSNTGAAPPTLLQLA